MRVVIRLETKGGSISLPIHYNRLIQGFIYRNISKALADRYHNGGFSYGKRHYKLFVFSRLLSRKVSVDTASGIISFKDPVYLKIGALDTRLLESLAIYLLKRQFIKLGGNLCRFASIEVESPINVDGSVLVKAISPISVHRTLYDKEGRKKTYYFSPWEAEFSELILDNLKRKAKAFYGESVELPEVEHPVVVPVRVSSGNLKTLIYRKNGRDYVIKGWMGLYELRLPQFYFDIAYSAGLGARNSLGFGMVEVVKGSKNSKAILGAVEEQD